MELKRALILMSPPRRGIFRSKNNLVKDQRIKRQGNINVTMGALEMAKRQGLVCEQSTKDNNGVIRIRIVVKKSELEKLIMHGHGGGDDGYDDVSLPSLVEQRLKQLRRKHNAKNDAGKKKKGISWAPALRSIPEEF